MLDATPKIINGQAVAVAGGQTINLGEAIAAGAEGLLDPLTGAGTLAAQGSNLCGGGKGGGNGGLKGTQPEDKGRSEQAKGSLEHNGMCEAARHSQDPMVREILSQKFDDGVNATSQAILKDGYYEVNGMKFTEYYYNRLWSSGREAPSLIAKKVLETADSVIVDINKPGFLRYKTVDWEVVYNPATKEIWHLQPL